MIRDTPFTFTVEPASSAGTFDLPRKWPGLLPGDAAMIASLHLHLEIVGTYDLDSGAPESLQRWQSDLLLAFIKYGSTGRLAALETALPDLRLGLWRTPSDGELTVQEFGWWRRAKRFYDLTRLTPASHGVLHPRTPAILQEWAQAQLHALTENALGARQRGEMRRLGLLDRHRMVFDTNRAIAGVQPLMRPGSPFDRRQTASPRMAEVCRRMA